MSGSGKREAIQRSTQIARFVVSLMTSHGWQCQMNRSRVSESWYLRLRNGRRYAMLRISFHGSKKGWKTVNSVKQAEEFARHLIKGAA